MAALVLATLLASPQAAGATDTTGTETTVTDKVEAAQIHASRLFSTCPAWVC